MHENDTPSSADVFYNLKANIENRSDEEITDYVANLDGGAEATLDLIFSQLPGAFRPERAGDRSISFQYEIETGRGVTYYYADVRDGACSTGAGKLPDPKVTMSMAIPIFLQVLTGTMAPARAFLTGKVRVKGDMMSATKFESWFARPSQ